MKQVRDKYLLHLKNATILDVGGRGLNSDRSYRSLFEKQFTNYYVADIVGGLGVTHVMPGPYILPFEDSTFDLVVSGQMLEHCSNPFKSVAEMKRVLKPGHFIILIAPSTGPYHDSQDCWRFMKDAWKAIADEVGLELIDQWITKKAPDKRSQKWSDNVFVGKRPRANNEAHSPKT